MSNVSSHAVEISIWASTMAEALDQAASDRPTPGGGSVSIIAATFGLAMVHKVASISLKRCKDDFSKRQNLTALCDEVSASTASLSSLADADSSAYLSYIAARSLPRETESEKSVRNRAMEAGLLKATRVPLSAAGEMCRALEFTATAITLSDTHLLSDIFAGALLIQSSIQGVLLSVDANLPGIPGAERESIKRERAELEDAAIAKREAIAQAYQRGIQP